MTLPAPNVFSNNAAFAFVDALATNPSWGVATDAFRAVVDYPGDLEFDDSAYVLVAAALVAARRTGEPAIPSGLKSLIDALGDPSDDVLGLARQAFPIALAHQARLADQHLDEQARRIWGAYVNELEGALHRSGATS